MMKRIFLWIGGLAVVAALGAGYYGLYLSGAGPFELVLTSVMVLIVVAVFALVLHLRALHRALFQHAQVAYKGFMLDFFLALKQLMREREDDASGAVGDLTWNLIEDYFRREAELYNTVVEELYDKTSMMHMLDRTRIRKEVGLGDPRPVEPLYSEVHRLLERLREDRMARDASSR